MHTRIDIIDGQEVTVKVYATRPLPKKCTAKAGRVRCNWKRKARFKREKLEQEKFNKLCQQIAKDNAEKRRAKGESD
jgi:hypothetical protein